MDFNIDIDKISEALIFYLPKIALALLTLFIGFWIIGRITNMFRRAMERRKIDPSVTAFLASIIGVGFKVLVLLSIASQLGVATTSFVAIIGALAFAIGLALQGTLGHFASGVLLLVFRPYRVGDLVTIGGGQTGTVKELQIFNTVLATLDNKRVIVPNGTVTSNIITNISGQDTIGLELTFGIGYGDSIDRAREVIVQVAKDCPYVLDDPAPAVVVSSLGDSSVNLSTRPFVKSEDYWPGYFYMQEFVKKGLDQAGIGIPFPQMDVHIQQS